MKKKVVGLLGGTFDPIHFGHINLAIQMMEACDLDEVLFCPANVAPHKIDRLPIASAAHRMAMTDLAIADIEGFVPTGMEVARGGVSYTIDTIRLLLADHYDTEYKLIIAEDSMHSFFSWKEAAEILRLLPVLVGRRAGAPYDTADPRFVFVKTDALEISGCKIRERLKKGLYCGHLMPAKVLDYIYRHHLYYYHEL